MGLLSFLTKRAGCEAEMPIGAALDMLDEVVKKYPYSVIDWVDTHPKVAKCVVDVDAGEMLPQKWNGPFRIEFVGEEGNRHVINLAFQNLRRDIKLLCAQVAEAGSNRNVNVSNGNDESLDAVGFMNLLSLLMVSDEALEKFPSILETKSQYDSHTIALVGVIYYFSAMQLMVECNSISAKSLLTIADEARRRERELNRIGFVPIRAELLLENLEINLNRHSKSLAVRSKELAIEQHKLLALDIAGWIYYTLTKGKCNERERSGYTQFVANVLMREIAA